MGQFSYHPAWGQATSEDQQDIIDFWLTEKALPSAQAAQNRVAQVVMFARNQDGGVSGVCTATPQNPHQLGQPVYFYRSFIAREYRQTLLVFRMLKKATALLETDAREHDWPCIGILLELENERFNQRGRMPVWPGIDFVYLGKSPRGLECRVHWFRDARLKS